MLDGLRGAWLGLMYGAIVGAGTPSISTIKET
jgi:hypothetical protein